MEVVHLGKASDLISKPPKPPTYLDASAKKHFLSLAKILITAKILKNTHLTALEILSQNKAQFEWALKAINKKNRKKLGAGYIQTFQSGASNITAEMSVKKEAEKTMLQVIKQFGLDPKAEKDLKSTMVDPDQGDLFNGFSKRKQS